MDSSKIRTLDGNSSKNTEGRTPGGIPGVTLERILSGTYFLDLRFWNPPVGGWDTQPEIGRF